MISHIKNTNPSTIRLIPIDLIYYKLYLFWPNYFRFWGEDILVLDISKVLFDSYILILDSVAWFRLIWYIASYCFIWPIIVFGSRAWTFRFWGHSRCFKWLENTYNEFMSVILIDLMYYTEILNWPFFRPQGQDTPVLDNPRGLKWLNSTFFRIKYHYSKWYNILQDRNI